MSAASPSSPCQSILRNGNLSKTYEQHLVREEPLSIRVQGVPYSVVMRTPGDEIAHVAGFCLAEGIVDRHEDIKTIAFCEGEVSNVVTVTLTPERHAKVLPQLDRRAYISQTSCGLCGKELIDDIQQVVSSVKHPPKLLAMHKVLEAVGALPSHQPLRLQTRATHAAAIYDQDMQLMTVAEDVGRHNALDKAIGHLFLDDRLTKATLLILSSRISYELVQKAARADIPIIAAHSRPTELAVKLAESIGMTLVCLAKEGGLLIFSHPQHLE